MESAIFASTGDPGNQGWQTSMMRILLVDAHTLFREGLKMLLSTRDATIVAGEASFRGEALSLAGELLPDVILTDIVLHNESALDLVPALKSASPLSRVIILSDQRNESLTKGLLEAGADGFVLKMSAYEELDRAIKTVLSGHRFLSPEILDLIVVSYLAGSTSCDLFRGGRFSSLTDRERRILRLFCEEKPPKAIAAELGISRKTVDIHKRNIKKKLGVESDIGLVRLAIDADLPLARSQDKA